MCHHRGRLDLLTALNSLGEAGDAIEVAAAAASGSRRRHTRSMGRPPPWIHNHAWGRISPVTVVAMWAGPRLRRGQGCTYLCGGAPSARDGGGHPVASIFSRSKWEEREVI